MTASGSLATVCVTGGTGFLGAHVVASLAEEGHRVRVLYRDRERLRVLEDLDIEPVRGEVLDPASMRRAMKGCDALFHVAGVVASQPVHRVYEVNARGPVVAIEAAARAGAGRVVLTSSVAGVGPSPAGVVVDETQEYRTAHFGLTYVDSKHEGEATALAAAARTGVELVTVGPSYVLGVGRARELPGETSTRLIGNYIRGRLPAVVDSVTNIVDVEDVARGHLLAWRRGRPGERYILGGENVRWAELLRRVARISGADYPFVVIPPELAPAARMAAALRFPSPVSLEAVALMSHDYAYSSAKAERELGYSWRGLDEVLQRTVGWYLELMGDGRFRGRDLSAMRAMSAAMQVAGRMGVLDAAQRSLVPLVRRLGRREW